MVIDLKTQNQIITERKQGRSIPEIARKLGLPKSTVWRYVQSVKLTARQKLALRRAQGGGRKYRLLREQKAEASSRELVTRGFNQYIGPLLLAMLYWAEGTKSSFVFTNTDSEMIILFLHVLRKDFEVTNDRLQVMIRLGETFDRKKELAYWSSITKISVSDLRCNVNSKYNRTTTKHGLCRITLSRGAQMLKLMRAMQTQLTNKILDA